jgi:hypothetical protein
MAAKTRTTMRWIHLLGAAWLGTYLYSPFKEIAWFDLATQIAFFPVLSLTGIWMWKPQWFRRK